MACEVQSGVVGMKGFLIVLFALIMFALSRLCCEEKRPAAVDTAQGVSKNIVRCEFEQCFQLL